MQTAKVIASVKVKAYCGSCSDCTLARTAKVPYKCARYDNAHLEHDGTGVLLCPECIVAEVRRVVRDA